MLLPSSLPCDASQASPIIPRHQPGPGDIPSPPDTPHVSSSHNALGNIMNTCRSLQSLISMASASPCDFPAPPALTPLPLPLMLQLPTPPLMHMPAPIKLRLRPNANRSESPSANTRRRIVRRNTAKAPVKRRRVTGDDGDDHDNDDDDDEMARHGELASGFHGFDGDFEIEQEQFTQVPPLPAAPSTPKRSRIAPRHLPLGLERSDFHDLDILQVQGGASSSSSITTEHDKPGTSIVTETDGSEWSIEDDHILVELVLEKLKLSKEEWLDCAKSLGKDRHVVSRRWRSLVINGDVALKTRSSRRPSLYSTWR